VVLYQKISPDQYKRDRFSYLIPSIPAIQNNLKLNTNKSLEIIVHFKHRKLTNSLHCIPDVSRVESLSILGVQFNQVLSFGSHVRAVVGKAARSMHALNNHGARFCGARCMGRYASYSCFTITIC